MRHTLLALHLLFAIFAVGPLVHAATTAGRGVKAANADAIATSVRTVRIYGFLSLLVVVFGFSLVQPKYHHRFGETWIWLSLVLFAIAFALIFAVLLPLLQRAATAVRSGAEAHALIGRIAASGGGVALLFAAITVLMAFRPGK